MNILENDEICPNGKVYDVKNSGFLIHKQYTFAYRNVHKDKIEILYLLAFNEGYTELEYTWRVSTWEFVDDT